LYDRIILQETDLKTSKVLKYSAREGWKKNSYIDCVKNEDPFIESRRKGTSCIK